MPADFASLKWPNAIVSICFRLNIAVGDKFD